MGIVINLAQYKTLTKTLEASKRQLPNSAHDENLYKTVKKNVDLLEEMIRNTKKGVIYDVA
jgi:hypothetical protein